MFFETMCGITTGEANVIVRARSINLAIVYFGSCIPPTKDAKAYVCQDDAIIDGWDDAKIH